MNTCDSGHYTIELHPASAYPSRMYNISQAQRNFEKLLREAARGKEIIITRYKTPVAKLKAIVAKPKKTRKKSG